MIRILMKTITTIALAAGMTACSPSGAQAQNVSQVKEAAEVNSNWTVDKSASSISFSSEMNGEAFTGHFGNFTADIQFDPSHVSDARIHVSIDMTSADANDEERNDALPGKEWFSAKKFPSAVFNSNSVKATLDDQFEAAGALTIRDVTKPLILPFRLEIVDGIAHATAQTSIDRSDFGVGTGVWKSEDWVAHKVEINIKIKATKKTI